MSGSINKIQIRISRLDKYSNSRILGKRKNQNYNLKSGGKCGIEQEIDLRVGRD